MRFEHRKQKVANYQDFAIRLVRYALFGLVLIGFSLVLGILGYHFLDHLDLIDSLHMSCMILTGMGPVAEITTVPGKLFSSFYALYSGIAFLSITAVFLAPIIHRLLHILHVENADEEEAR